MANITTSMVDELRANVSGTVAQPGESSYDEAVNIWNASCARRPAIVARCTSSADVAAALRFARQQSLVVSVRGGGHNYAGGALCDDGLMIDLTPMKAVSVDAGARRAKCGGGTTWGELDAATQAHGLAIPGGFISRTGVAGLTLGGGFGWLSRLAGLSSDNLVGAEVVTADGGILRASDADNADLTRYQWNGRAAGGSTANTKLDGEHQPISLAAALTRDRAGIPCRLLAAEQGSGLSGRPGPALKVAASRRATQQP